jgi:hypothetical protein
MVNSANSECLLCGALARGHFVPIPDAQSIEENFEADQNQIMTKFALLENCKAQYFFVRPQIV